MDENFSRIEDYINNKLSGTEKGKFESELKSNTALAEKFNFYRNLQGQQSPELKPIKFTKKILPEINDINFTEKKQKPGIGKGSAAGILIIFIAVSAYLLFNNVSQNRNIANMQFVIDSMNTSQEQYAEIQKDNIVENNTIKSDTVLVLQKLITSKEDEIAALKLNNKSNETLKVEVEQLKKELAKVKQEYYENTGTYAAENTSNKELDNFVKSISVFVTRADEVKVVWESNDKFRVSMYNYKDGKKVYSSPGFIKNVFSTKIPEHGFFLITFKAVSKKEIKVLASIPKNKSTEVFYKK
jgi:hypothetical protein